MGTRPPNNNAIRVPLRETAVAALLVDVRPSIQPVPDGDSPRSRNRFDKVGHRLATCHWMGRGRSQGQTGSTPCHQMHRETVCRSRRLYLRRAFSRSNLALSRTPLDLPLTSPPDDGGSERLSTAYRSRVHRSQRFVYPKTLASRAPVAQKPVHPFHHGIASSVGRAFFSISPSRQTFS